jgi:sigma-B regulation protein RsbU (phosphoserine phosphatase)
MKDKLLFPISSIRSGLIPSNTARIHGLDYYGDCRFAAESGGDFFDCLPLSDGGLLCSVGDVPGCAGGAALLTSGLQALLRSLGDHSHREGRHVAQELNRFVYDLSDSSTYATLFYATVDPLKKQLEYVNAGHEAALLIRHDTGRLERLERTGPVLGLLRRAEYHQRIVAIEPGDLLIAFTDGVTDTLDRTGSQFGESGILRTVRERPEASAAELVHGILETVDRASDWVQEQDRTALVVRLLGVARHDTWAEHAEDLAFAAA